MAEVGGKWVTAVADFAYWKDGKLIFEEVKAGEFSSLSKGQKAVYAEAIKQGAVMVTDVAKAAALGNGVRAMELIGAKMGVSLVASATGRAAGEFARMVGRIGVGMVVGFGLPFEVAAQTLLFSNTLGDATLRPCPPVCAEVNPRDRH